jgi:hypothetical protein
MPAVERFGSLAVVGLSSMVRATEIAKLDDSLAFHLDAELVVLDGSIVSEFEPGAVRAVARLLGRADLLGLRVRFFNLRSGVGKLLEARFSRYLPVVTLEEVMRFLKHSNSEATGIGQYGLDAAPALPSNVAA